MQASLAPRRLEFREAEAKVILGLGRTLRRLMSAKLLQRSMTDCPPTIVGDFERLQLGLLDRFVKIFRCCHT